VTGARSAAAAFLATVTVLAVTHTAARGSAWRSGLASAYSNIDSPGRMACTGRRVPDDELLVAHKTLRCGSRVRVCVRRGRCVTVRVADRGPYIHGRVLDLTPGAVKALGYRSIYVWGVRRVSWRTV
jgi:rare lipoprotein A